jgi:hypothetical protein
MRHLSFVEIWTDWIFLIVRMSTDTIDVQSSNAAVLAGVYCEEPCLTLL